MADGTRFKMAEDRLRSNENRLQQLQQLAVVRRPSGMAEVKSPKIPTTESILVQEAPISIDQFQRQDSQNGIEGFQSANFGGNRPPIVDFPQFDGKKPWSWVRRCEHFFAIFNIQESQKVELAAGHMVDRAKSWVQEYLLQTKGVRWTELSESACFLFGEKQGMEIVDGFYKLSQGDRLEEYNEQFEELRSGMLFFNPYLPKSYVISCYINGLKLKIQSLVKLGRPKELTHAMESAMFYNKSVQANDPQKGLTPQRANGEITRLTQESEIQVILCDEHIRKLDSSPQIVEKFTKPEIPCNPSKLDAPMTADQDESTNSQETIEASSQETKVILNSCEITKKDREIKLLVELVVLLIDWIEIRLANSSTNPIGYLGNFSACKVFVEMPSLIVVDCCLDFDSFEPESISFGTKIKQNTRNWPYDRGKFDVGKRGMWATIDKVGHSLLDQNFVLELLDNGLKSLPIDRVWIVHGILSCILIFDPGGELF